VVLSRTNAARARQAAAIAAGLAPALWAAYRYASGTVLIVDPVADLTTLSGLSAVAFLSASLAVSPAVRFLGWRWAHSLRRTLGLIAFAYAVAHMLVFVALDYGLDLRAILSEGLLEKPFILLGFAALLILAALAATSTKAAMRRMGRRWTQLHRSVYAAAVLVAIHQSWAVKDPLAQVGEWAPWALVLGALLVVRLPAVRARLGRARRAATVPRVQAPPAG